MALDFGIFKRHPVASVGAGLVVFVIIYYLASEGSSSSASTASSGVYGYNANDLAYLQLQAAQTEQANQIGGQVQVASIQASVANTQTQAQVQLGDDTLAAQLAGLQASTAAQIATTQSNNDAQVQITNLNDTAQTSQVQLQAQENEDQTAALLGTFTAQTQAQTEQQANTLAYLTSVANDQTSVATTGINDQSAVIENGQNNAAVLSGQTIGALTANNGLSRNNTQLAEVLSTIDAALGQPGASVAASSTASSTAASSAAVSTGILSTLSNLGGALFAGA